MSGGSLTPTELQRASRQWDEACQTLPEEWQLIEVRLRHERAVLINSKAGQAHEAIARAPADGSPPSMRPVGLFKV